MLLWEADCFRDEDADFLRDDDPVESGFVSVFLADVSAGVWQQDALIDESLLPCEKLGESINPAVVEVGGDRPGVTDLL